MGAAPNQHDANNDADDAKVLKAVNLLCDRRAGSTTLNEIAAFTGLDRSTAQASIVRLSNAGAVCERAAESQGRRVCIKQPC